MKVEHFRALYLHKFIKNYEDGANDAKDQILKTRYFENITKIQFHINNRRFKRAAYYLGYADNQIQEKQIEPIRRRYPQHNQTIT